jgi:hypothetical protein
MPMYHKKKKILSATWKLNRQITFQDGLVINKGLFVKYLSHKDLEVWLKW